MQNEDNKKEESGKENTEKASPKKSHEKKKPSEEERIKELECALCEKDEKLKRSHADFDNYRKFVEREKENARLVAGAGILKDMLEILDDLEAAVKNEKDEKTKGAFKSIFSKSGEIMKKHGLSPIDSIGKKFDPHIHEALMQEKSDMEEGTILEEFQKGYMLNGKVLRHSKVKIAN